MSNDSDRSSHVPPTRYKSSARPWCDIPGHCGFYTGTAPKKHPCNLTATHRCVGIGSDGKPNRYGWLCKGHSTAVASSGRMHAEDLPLIEAGRTCDVWKCSRRATHWTQDGYAVCNNCSGN